MKALFAKYWPSVVHLAAVVIVFLQPSIEGFAASHQKSSAAVLLVWGWLLHWAQSPKETPASKF